MVPTPIPSHLVYTVFQYILPPSLPLPTHLLSKRLIERHHFLSISPTDPVSYLCWPSTDTAEVAAALERGFQETSQPEHDVRYTAPDDETVLAHVRPDAQSSLQIVFIWDTGSDSWKYHDARMLPFPDASQPSLDVTLARRKTVLEDEERSVFTDQSLHGPRSQSPRPDDYWAGYESSESSPVSSALPPNILMEDDDKAEAAYWASYSIVQGSGDSTVPSPRPEKERTGQDEKPPRARGPDTTFDPLVTHLHLRLQQENGLSIPRFSRSGRSHSPTSVNGEKQPFGDKIEMIEHNEGDDTKDGNWKMVGPVATESICSGTHGDKRDGNDDGVKEAIRGIYRMWKAQSRSGDADTFLAIVKRALE